MEKTEEIEKPLSFDLPVSLKNRVKIKAVKDGQKLKFVGKKLFEYWLKYGLPE